MLFQIAFELLIKKKAFELIAHFFFHFYHYYFNQIPPLPSFRLKINIRLQPNHKPLSP